MPLKTWLIIFFCIFLIEQAYGQQTILNKTINLEVKDIALKDVLIRIEKQSGTSFAFNPNKIPLDVLVTYQAKNKSLESVLVDISTFCHFNYKVIEQQIVLLPDINIAPLAFNLSGTVTDKLTGESLIGATIRVDTINYGTISNGYGFYSIALPYGKHVLHISYIGYKILSDTLNLVKNITRDLYLNQTSPQLKEIIVQGYKPPNVELVQTGKTSISPNSVAESSAALGESDVIKSLERIPGIKLQSEGSTFFYVRGGNRDQNLLLIDDAPIYNPTHLFGLFSTIIPETTNSIDVYKSNFPLSKGGRLSSVIDIKTKEGNKNRFSAWGNIGIISTQLGIEGPFKKGQNSYILTGRFSRIKWFFKQEIPNLDEFKFNDLTGKINFKLNDKNKLYFSFYTGSDRFLTEESGLGWSNFNGSIRWNKLLNENTFVNTTLYGSNYEYLFYMDRKNEQSWRSRIGEIGVKTDFTRFINRKQELAWGFSLNGRTINPGNIVSKDSIPPNDVVSVKNNLETVGYIQHEVKIGSKWGLKYGIRASLWTSMGDSFEYTFNDTGFATDTTKYNVGEIYHNYFKVEPRLTTSYFISKNTSVKVSYDRSVQNLHLISNSLSPFSSFEIWLPSGPNIKPQLADQFSLGYYHFLPNIGISLQAESYYKILKNQIDYTAHASTILNPVIENELIFGKTNTYGIELFAKKETGRIRGMIGYTLSKAKSRFNELNKGNSFIANTDRPHYLSLNLNYDVALRVTLSTNFIYSSGIPFSTPTSFYLFNGSEIPVYGQKNNSRIPAYHRLDFSAKFTLNKNLTKKFKHSITLVVYNFYGRKNPVFINFNKSIDSNGAIEVPTNLLAATRISSQFYVYGFVPSINYQFRF